MFYIKGLLILIEILSSILLIVIILLQRSKNEGLGLAFGSQMGESLFGARAGNVLVKATVWVGIIFLLNTTVLAKIYSKGTTRSLMSESGVPAPMTRQVPAPGPAGQPANQSQAPMSAPISPAEQTPSPVIPVSVPAATPAPVSTPAPTPAP